MRTRILLPLLFFALIAGASACGDDDDTGTDNGDTVTVPNGDDEGGENDGEDDGAVSGNGSATMTFQGVTYDLDEVWCDPFEDRRQWMAFDSENFTAGIQIRNGSESPRYSIEVDLDDNTEIWRFNVVGGAESDEAVEAREAIDASDDAIRGEGLRVWPIDAEPDERDELAETVDFDITC